MNDFIDNPKTSAEMTFDDQLQIYHRGPGDLGIWAEQKLWEPMVGLLKEDDTVLDVGAHIGLFQKKCRDFGFRGEIYCVEPDPNNIRVLHKNTSYATSVLELAIVPDTHMDREVDVYLGKTYPAANTIRPIRGRSSIKVKAMNWGEILAIQPTVIKFDAESLEYELNWRELPSSVRIIMFEYHFFKPEDEYKMWEIDEVLMAQGFLHDLHPRPNHFKKTCMAFYRREE